MDWNEFLKRISDKSTDDSVTPSMSPLDLIPYGGLANGASDIIGNEVGSIGREVAPQLPSQLADVGAQQDTANMMADMGSDLTDVSRSQQGLSRAQDFADRAALQKQQASAQRFARLKSMMGR